jgi:pilus assembly protein CpaB
MSRTLLLISAALLVGGLFLFWLYKEEFRARETGGPLVAVLAAAQDIELGQPIRQEWLTTKEIPQNYVEERHLPASAARDLVGLPLAQTVRAGEAILRTDLSTISDARRTLSGSIPAGMRAVTVLARPTSTFGGLLRPGDRVDVLVTVGTRELQETWRQAVVLENVLVLAVGQEFEVREGFDLTSTGAQAESREVRFGRATNITLQVTIEQGAALTVARDEGVITLLLRNPNDVTMGQAHPELVAADIFDPARRARFMRRTVAVAHTLAPAPVTGGAFPGGVVPGPAATP